MANILYANNAAGTLSAGITNASPSLTLNAGQGALFPLPAGQQFFYVTLTDAATQTLIEIVKVTAVSGDIFSITRAQDGTSAQSWSAGDIVSLRTIRLELQGFENAAEGLFAAQNVPITPSTTLGIIGTTVADNANAGSVGEYRSVLGPSFAATSTALVNIATTTLSAGDWDVWGTTAFSANTGAVVSFVGVGISLTSATFGGIGSVNSLTVPFTVNTTSAVSSPVIRVNVNTNTSVFMVATVTYGSGSVNVQGLLQARRVR